MAMINSTETISVVRYQCDNCGQESDVWELPDDASQLKSFLKEDGWTFDDDFSYCPECNPE